jgi:hypothetical protein
VDRGIGARLASVPALLAAATVLVAVTSTGLRLRDGARDRARGMQVAAVAEYVRANTPPGARLLVWGHAADVHFFSGRRPASRFVYTLALLTPGYADSALVAGFVNDLRAAAPPIIIDATPNAAKGEDLVPPLDHWDPDWHYPQDEGRLRWWTMTPALRAFYDYVAANYVATERVGPEQWVAYRLVDHTTHRSPGTGVAAAPHE